MRFKVPQNIDMPDRILGPLTLIQFVYAIVGGGTAYASLQSLPKPFGYFVAIPVALFTLAIIFIKINERPFSKFLLSFIQFVSKPKSRIWSKDEGSNFEVEIYTPPKKENLAIKHKEMDKEAVKKLADRVDEGSFKIKT